MATCQTAGTLAQQPLGSWLGVGARGSSSSGVAAGQTSHTRKALGSGQGTDKRCPILPFCPGSPFRETMFIVMQGEEEASGCGLSPAGFQLRDTG